VLHEFPALRLPGITDTQEYKILNAQEIILLLVVSVQFGLVWFGSIPLITEVHYYQIFYDCFPLNHRSALWSNILWLLSIKSQKCFMIKYSMTVFLAACELASTFVNSTVAQLQLQHAVHLLCLILTLHWVS